MATTQQPLTVEMDDGTVLHIHQPKSVYMLDLADTADSTGDENQDALNQIRAVRRLIDACLDPEERATLYDRVYDENDELDLLDLVGDLMPKILAAITARPTTPSSASPRPRKRTGPRSTARSRSTALPPSISEQTA